MSLESGRDCRNLLILVVYIFKLGWWNVPDWLKQSLVVEPVHPIKGLKLDMLKVTPRSPLMNHLRLIQPDYRFRKRIVVCVSDTSYRRLDTCSSQSFRVADGQVLNTPVARRSMSGRA